MHTSNTEQKTAYMVDSIKVKLSVMVMGQEKELPLSDLADGCIGVSLWFDTLEHATEWADDNDKISTATYESKLEQSNNNTQVREIA